MSKKYKYEYDLFQTIIIGFFKALWFLLSLPFRGIKFSRKKSGLSIQDRNYIATKRLEIEKMANSINDIELKHSVLEADKLVDYTLKAQGFYGETFADRLRSAEQSLNPSIYDRIWQGHKIRNQIAHEQNLNLSKFELKKASENLLPGVKTL